MCVCALCVQKCVSADKHTVLCESVCSLHILAIMFVCNHIMIICVWGHFLPSFTVYLSACLCVYMSVCVCVCVR